MYPGSEPPRDLAATPTLTSADVGSGAGPTQRAERITNLDSVRGVATLGILVMNGVSYGLAEPAYFNLDAGGSVSSAVLGAVAQFQVGAAGAGLGSYWLRPDDSAAAFPMSDAVELFLAADFFLRSLGMMLIGVALYRLDVLQGRLPVEVHRRMAVIGLAVGLPLAIAGVAWQIAADFDPAIAIVSSAPNTIATVPLAIGYLGLITLWDRRPTTGFHRRGRAVGRMALTNYLAQTIMGVLALRVLLGRGELSRVGIALFVVGVWAAQLLWSKSWLQRYRFGPFEWIWRCATYRKIQPIRA